MIEDLVTILLMKLQEWNMFRGVIAESINWNMQQITKLDQYIGHLSMIKYYIKYRLEYFYI